jgi:plastocyanin
MAKEYSVTFQKEGTWTYICTLHSAVVPIMGPVGMVGKIMVKRSGASLALTPDQVAAKADADIKADIASAEAADADARKVTSRPGVNGATIYTMNVGFSTKSGGELLRFSASDLAIKVGDTVEWVQKAAQAPHTISFFSGGGRDA